ncbi:hypothetical protein [Natrialbaceae archaeon AArc-T1-2]|uniref:hypothetical protein n=1 Tax=Natrialbaceae archaeon AArc-T1-2 TaxID=3053904 RepID=UPI00255B3AE7|nr:hypothetical protein [Natrialbaceae archaeon AArc-T1-2]WIV67505.1 hypothetical protein QQ977_01885 [Natrialbaceae archaeon AArc-T1-2]
MNAKPLSVLAVVGLLVFAGTGGLAVQSTATVGDGDSQTQAQTQTHANETDADGYVFEQGSVCQPIEPLESGDPIDEFYDYRDHETHPEDGERLYSSYGTTHLQEDDTSILFLHDGPDGLSLVMVHGQLDGNGDPNYMTFDIVGLPGQAEWVVRNDAYTSETNRDEFHRGDGWANASWIQRGDRTGGGAIQGGLDGEFAVTVQPAFNDDATLTHENHGHPNPDFYGEGEVESWDVLSGSADEPDRTTLPSLEEPVTIRTGTCDDPSITYDRTDDAITASIGAATPDDSVAVQPTTGSTDGVEFERLEVTDVDGDASVTVENSSPEPIPESPENNASIANLAVTGDHDASATVTFSVDGDVLEDADLEPEEVALYERDGNGDDWSELETTVHDDGDTYRFSADGASLTDVAVAQAQPASDDSDGDSGTSGSEPSEQRANPIPGFGILVVVAAVSLVTLWAVRAYSR